MLKFHAYAKINLTLEVPGRRADGYHEIASIMQNIDLADTLSFQEDDAIRFHCDVPELISPDNLVVRAARLLKRATGCGKGVSVHLVKGIPWDAGLGGGASDAAVALRALGELWGLSLPLDRLLELAAELGSDVPFYLYGGTALVEGRGERVTPLPPLPTWWLLLLKPAVSIPRNKTKTLYSCLESSHFTQGGFTKKLVSLLGEGKLVPKEALLNVFEKVAFDVFPGLDDFRRNLLACGADRVHLAGSGPTLFALARDSSQGEGIRHCLGKAGIESYLVRTVDIPAKRLQ